MTAITIMARALACELRSRGIVALSADDCEVIMRKVFERTAAVANARPVSREEADDGARRST